MEVAPVVETPVFAKMVYPPDVPRVTADGPAASATIGPVRTSAKEKTDEAIETLVAVFIPVIDYV